MEAETMDDLRGTQQFDDLPPTLTVPAAAALLGVGRTLGYELARSNQIPVLRLGNRLVVPTRRLLAMLGEDAAPASDRSAVANELGRASAGSR